MELICCMKSIASYNKLRQLFENSCSFEENIENIEAIQGKIVFNKYDIGVVDRKLLWKDAAIELLSRKGVEIIIFDGDFEYIKTKISAFIKSEKEDTNSNELITIVDEDYYDNDINTIVDVTDYAQVSKETGTKAPIYKEVYAGIQNKLIGVINLSENSGSTFISLNLAKMLANYGVLPGVIESHINPVIFNIMGMEKKLGDNFFSVHNLISERRKMEKNVENIIEDILFIVPDTRKYLSSNWDYDSMMKLLYSSKKSAINIFDIGNNFESQSIQSIIEEFDILLVVIDPLQKNFNARILKLINDLSQNVKVNYIVNKWNNGYEKNKIVSKYGVRDYFYVPFIAMNVIDEATKKEFIPYNIGSVKDIFDKLFSKLIRDLIPPELLKSGNSQDNNSSTMQKSKPEKKVEYIPFGCNELAFMGVSHGVGVTHTGIMFAYCLCNKYKVAILEMNQSGAFLEIKRLLADDNSTNNTFRSGGVDFYYDMEYLDFITKFKDSYDFVLLDLGCYEDADIDDLIRADKKIILGQGVDWKLKEIKNFYESTQKQDLNSSWYYLIPFLSDKDLGDIRNIIKNKVLALPFNINPFSPSDNIKSICNRILGIKDGLNTKKGFFGAFIKK